jgi:hypothetical protein
MSKLLVATPFRGAGYWASDVKLGYAESLRLLSTQLDYFPPTVQFSEDVVNARNRIAAAVLREHPDVTHVLWWDDDCWPGDVGIVRKMIESGLDVVACSYTNKSHPVRWVHEVDALALRAWDGASEYVPARSVGFGFTITSRDCLEQMAAYTRRIGGDSREYWDYTPRGKFLTPNLFGKLYERMPDGDESLRGEDYSFCRRWRDMGGKIWLYNGPGNLVTHAGPYGFSAADMPGAQVTR